MAKLTGASNTGPMGPQGDPGTDGVDGSSAYEIAVANGFVGTEAEWLASLVGPEGPEGSVAAHDHDADYAPLVHNHDAAYAALSHTHTVSDISSGTFAASFIPSLDASKITTGTLDTARIPNLAATKITSGTLDAARLPTHTHSGADITSGTLDAARIPSLDASKITSGTLGLGRIPTGTSSSTVALGNRGVPTGGSTGWVLAKTSGTDYAMAWGRSAVPATNSGEASNVLSLSSTTTLVTVATATLAAGQNYLIEAHGFIEAYGSAGVDSTGRIRIAIDGTNTTSPIDEFFIAGVHSPKVQYASLVVSGSDATKNVNLIYVHASNSTSVRWAKLYIRVTPV